MYDSHPLDIDNALFMFSPEDDHVCDVGTMCFGSLVSEANFNHLLRAGLLGTLFVTSTNVALEPGPSPLAFSPISYQHKCC